jgi:selenocysteine lyase/cysteine desulfurase
MKETEDSNIYFSELEQSVEAALETYSNVHRGSGHYSMVSTHLFEQAREIILEYLGLKKGKYVVIFCSTLGADVLKKKLASEKYQIISSRSIGLSLGVSAFVADRKALKGVTPVHTGGGTTVLISPGWIIWAAAPDRFEAGTPAIINIIAFARALVMIKKYGKEIFLNLSPGTLSSAEILHNDDLEKYSGKELLDEFRKTLIGRGKQVPTAEGLRPFINFDNSASTPTFEPIWDTFRQTLLQTDQVKHDIINEVKSICYRIIGAPAEKYDLIFTSNTTEAINLSADSVCRESNNSEELVVLSSMLEHSSNDLPWRMISNSVIRLSIDENGFVDIKEMDRVLDEYNQKGLHGNKRIKIVAISGASNVMGSFSNIEEISLIVHKYGAKLLVDAAQLVAHRKIEVEKWGVDYLAFSAHKVYAPFGTGVLVARKGLLNFKPDELEQIRLSGEENAGGIAALGKSLLLIERIGFDLIQEEEKALTRRALLGLKKIDGLKVYGINDPDSPAFSQKGGVIVFFLKGLMSNKVAEELALQGGIGIRSGCHCAHILVKHILGVSPGLERFQRVIFRLFNGLRPPGVARISFGIENSAEEVDIFLRVLENIAGKKLLAKGNVKKQNKAFVKEAALRVYS